ncbi:SUKH-4 family immunity protein [Streptomyces sp. NPDC002004]
MGTTGTIVLDEGALRPCITHESTLRWLTGPGLPAGSSLFGFEALRKAGRPDRLADAVGVPELLPGGLGDLLVVGDLLSAAGETAQTVLLDGASGEVFTTFVLHDRPDMTELTPLAPSVGSLVRFMTLVEELRDTRGQFASLAGRFGTKAVAEAQEQLLAVFEEGTGGAVPAYWRIAAVVHPLARIAGPGSGLRLEIPERLLDREFGDGEIVRFEDVDLPGVLTHEPSRRFLTRTGLPEDGVPMFQLDTDVPLPTLVAYHEEDGDDGEDVDCLPDGADRLIRLGHLAEDTDLVVDGATGAVFAWVLPEASLLPLNADLSTLAFTLWLVHRERAVGKPYEVTAQVYEQLAATMTNVLDAVDPVACRVTAAPDDHWRYWPEVFKDQAGPVL